MNAYDRWWAFFDRIIGIMIAISAVLVFLMALAVTADVLIRYLLNITFVSLFEISEYSLLWITFLATPWIMKNNGHVRVDLLLSRLRGRPRGLLNIAASFISTLILFSLTLITAQANLNDFLTGFTLTGVLMLPKWPLEIVIPIGFSILTLQTLRMTCSDWKEFKLLSSDKNLSKERKGGVQ